MIFVPDPRDLLAQYKDVWKLFISKCEVLCGVDRPIEIFILAFDRDVKAQVTFSFSIFLMHLLKTNIYVENIMPSDIYLFLPLMFFVVLWLVKLLAP